MLFTLLMQVEGIYMRSVARFLVLTHYVHTAKRELVFFFFLFSFSYCVRKEEKKKSDVLLFFFFFLSNSKKELHAGNTFSIERKKKGVFLFFFSCNDISKGKRRSFEVTASLLPLPLPLYLCISKFLRNNAEAGRHYPPRFLHHSGWDSCLLLSCSCFFFSFFHSPISN